MVVNVWMCHRVTATRDFRRGEQSVPRAGGRAVGTPLSRVLSRNTECPVRASRGLRREDAAVTTQGPRLPRLRLEAGGEQGA